MPYDLVIRDASVVSGDRVATGDIAVNDGKIVTVGKVSESGQTEVDAAGLHALPGLIDSQVHFREPGATHKEDIESGTRSAICGGVTTIFEMPNTNPPTVTAAALADKLGRANGRAWCDYGFFVGASGENVEALADLENLPGSPGIKIFVGSSTGSLLVEDDELLLRVLKSGTRRCALHSEDEPRLRARAALSSAPGRVDEHPFLRDAEAAALATRRIIALAREAGRPVHILHISTADEVPLISGAKAAGQDVSAEVTPQHLFFRAPDCYERLGTLVQMNPPIREAYHHRALWNGLATGVFDCFGSDHAPHTLEEKAQPYRAGAPSGMPGVQTMLPVLLRFVQEGRLALTQLVRMGCEAPAKLYGVAGKGALAPGFEADIVLVDLCDSMKASRWQIQSKSGWSPFEGEQLGAFPRAVYLRGHLAAENGTPVASPSGQSCRFSWKETNPTQP